MWKVLVNLPSNYLLAKCKQYNAWCVIYDIDTLLNQFYSWISTWICMLKCAWSCLLTLTRMTKHVPMQLKQYTTLQAKIISSQLTLSLKLSLNQEMMNTEILTLDYILLHHLIVYVNECIISSIKVYSIIVTRLFYYMMERRTLSL